MKQIQCGSLPASHDLTLNYAYLQEVLETFQEKNNSHK